MPPSAGSLNSPTKVTEKSGKQWIEFLCNQIDVNAYQLRSAIKSAIREGAGGVEERVHSNSITHIFVGKVRKPGDAVQKSVKLGVDWLHENNWTTVSWKENLHSYDAFQKGQVPLSGPLPLNVQEKDHAVRTLHYSGAYLMIRRNFRGQPMAEYLELDGKNRASADFGLRLKLREAKTGDGIIDFEGYAHATKSAIWGYGAHQCDMDGDHECLSVSISRNARDRSETLLGLILRRSSQYFVPVAQQVLLLKLSSAFASSGYDARSFERLQAAIDSAAVPLELESLRTNENLETLLDALTKSGVLEQFPLLD